MCSNVNLAYRRHVARASRVQQAFCVWTRPVHWRGGQEEEVHLGQREGMPQMQQTIHVRVREVPEEFSFKCLFACMHTSSRDAVQCLSKVPRRPLGIGSFTHLLQVHLPRKFFPPPIFFEVVAARTAGRRASLCYVRPDRKHSTLRHKLLQYLQKLRLFSTSQIPLHTENIKL